MDKYWFISNEVLEPQIYYDLEGYLFPDTYIFEKDELTLDNILTKILDNTDKKLTPLKADIEKSIYDVLIGNCKIEEAIIKTKYQKLHVIPATINLAGLDIELLEKSQHEPGYQKGNQLKINIDQIKKDFDYIIIDCPPSLGLITTNALTASDSVIIPVQCEFFALEGIMQLLNTIMLAQKTLNPDLQIEGVLLTMLDSRTNLGFEVVDDIRKFFKEKVYNTIIPRLIRLTEAPSHGEPIIAYDPKSRGSEAYLNLAKEVIERNGTE